MSEPPGMRIPSPSFTSGTRAVASVVVAAHFLSLPSSKESRTFCHNCAAFVLRSSSLRVLKAGADAGAADDDANGGLFAIDETVEVFKRAVALRGGGGGRGEEDKVAAMVADSPFILYRISDESENVQRFDFFFKKKKEKKKNETSTRRDEKLQLNVFLLVPKCTHHFFV